MVFVIWSDDKNILELQVICHNKPPSDIYILSEDKFVK